MYREKKLTPRAQIRGKSSSLEILGTPSQGGKVPARWADYHRLLTDLRDRFSGGQNIRSENAKAEIQSSGEHIADSATDSYDRDWALAMVSSNQDALYEIVNALERIAEGTYGICELTGKPIESSRLKAVPWTRFCAEAQSRLEAGGAVSRPHLGRRGNLLTSLESSNSKDEDPEEPTPASREP